MRKEGAYAEKLRNVFKKAAKGELQPNNFGNSLLTAIREGLCSEERVTNLLGVPPQRIRQTGNAMKQREIAVVARALGYKDPQ